MRCGRAWPRSGWQPVALLLIIEERHCRHGGEQAPQALHLPRWSGRPFIGQGLDLRPAEIGGAASAAVSGCSVGRDWPALRTTISAASRARSQLGGQRWAVVRRAVGACTRRSRE